MHHFRLRRRYRGPLRAVILDWAGTIVDYGSRAPASAIMQAFSARRVPLTQQEVRGPMGMAKLEHLAALLRLPRIRDRWRLEHGQESDENTAQELYGEFLEAQKRLLVEYAQLIPGTLDAVRDCRRKGLLIGSSTGYTRELMDLLVPLAQRLGFEPDAMVCASDVTPGRPAPWLCLENARRLGVYPMDAIVVVDDTTVGVEAGLNAGMWTVGVAKSGNLIGLSEAEFDALDAADQADRLKWAYKELRGIGAHFVIDAIADLPMVIDQVTACLRAGMAP